MKTILFTLAILTGVASARTVEYNLTIAEQKVNITGRSVTGMTINDGIPGPPLRFSKGDTAVMHVTNSMDVPTSVHWHGLLVPPGMDGVPFLSFPPIKPGTTFTYRFPIRQTGTYWYHSHSGLQEQRGVYGSIVILPKEKTHGEAKDHVVLLSDWTDQNPMEILRNLRRGSEFFGVQKKTAQSVPGASARNAQHHYLEGHFCRPWPKQLSRSGESPEERDQWVRIKGGVRSQVHGRRRWSNGTIVRTSSISFHC